MDERAKIAWLHRRVGFGLAPGELDELERAGVEAVLDRLLDGDGAGLPPNPDPWADVVLHPFEQEEHRGEDRIATVRAWILAMVATPRPLEEWMRWFWHGHLVSSLADVQYPQLMIQQLRTYGELGLGDARSLLRATAVDPAMLLYLDGAGSQAGAPNENFGRELLELFSLGVGNYGERDVQQAAAALTGWRVSRDTGQAVFDPRAHDDSPRTFLGVSGVHDVDTVIDAVVAHEACAPFLARSLAEAVLGAGVDEALVGELADRFRDEDLAVRPLLRRILEAGLEGRGAGAILRPVPWMVGAVRALQVPLGAAVTPDGRGAGAGLGRYLDDMGQVPMRPPNVSGWPGDRAWLASSVTVARANAAGLLAGLAPEDGVARQRAAAGDWDGVADVLGHPEGFGDPTRRALDQAARAGGPPGVAALTVAMASPEAVQA